MRRLKLSLLLIVLGAGVFPQPQPAQEGASQANPLVDPEVRRIGEELRCMCGHCSYTLTSCNMLSCSGAEYGRAKLLKLVREGRSEEQIKAAFVAEFGTVVLTSPPAEGFNLVGWLMPFAALLAGLLIVWWLLKTYLHKPAPEAVDDSVLERYKDRIEKDLTDFDS